MVPSLETECNLAERDLHLVCPKHRIRPLLRRHHFWGARQCREYRHQLHSGFGQAPPNRHDKHVSMTRSVVNDKPQGAPHGKSQTYL